MRFHPKRCKHYTLCSLAMFLLCGLIACRQTADIDQEPLSTAASSPVRKEDSSVTIYFATYAAAVDTFKSLAEEFHDLNPDIRVEVSAMQDYVTGGLSYEEHLYRTVTTADTGLWWIDHTATRYGLVKDLSAFIGADAGFDPEDFYPATLDAFHWDGGIWALPYVIATGLISYDKQAFADAGLPYPQTRWTQADFLRTAQQLTIREEGGTVRYGFVDLLNADLESFILSQVGSLHDPETGLPALDREEVAQAVRWYTDLALVDGVMPDPSADMGESNFRLVQAGRAAMWSTTLGATYGTEMQVSDIGFVPFPEADWPANAAYSNGYFMSSGTDYPQESWRWLNFLTRHRVEIWDDVLPARRSVAEQTQYWAQFEPEEAAAAQYAAERLSFTMRSEADDNLTKALSRIFKEGESIETALAEAQEAALAQYAQWAQATPRAVRIAPRELASEAETPTVTFAPPFYLMRPTDWVSIAEAFNREHSDMRVKIVNRDADAVDCMVEPVPLMQNTGAPAQFLNVQPLFDRETDSSLAGIPAHFQDALHYQGALWGVPFQAQAYIIYYNRELFDAAGEPYPQPGWTLDGFLATAQRLTRGSGDAQQWGYLPQNAPAEDLRVFLAVQGVALWDADGRPRFDAPEVVTAIARYTDLAIKHRVMPVFAQDFADYQYATSQHQKALISQGQVAMWSNYTGQQYGVAGVRAGMAPLPVNQHGHGTAVFRYEGLFVASETPHREVCWAWFRALSSEAELIEGIPARVNLLDSPSLQSRLGEETVATYRAVLEYDPLPALSLSEVAQIRWLYEAVGEILTGASPEGALGNAQQQTQ